MTGVYPEGVTVRRMADLSDDGRYRYWLGRFWADTRVMSLAFIMLNPSTADADDDDPTIRKCVGFARRLGYTGVSVFNLYAYRATEPRDLAAARRRGVDVVGPENDERLRTMLVSRMRAGCGVVAAWGAHAPDARVREVLAMPGSRALCTLGLTTKGVPRHPLMLGYEGATLKPLRAAAVDLAAPQDGPGVSHAGRPLPAVLASGRP